MNSNTPVAKNVDEYIHAQPAAVQPILQKVRQVIKKTAPKAEEVISYAIPGYKYHGMLIFFAAFKDHISVYPAPRENAAFKKELAKYKGGKGTVQFPLGQAVDFDLIKRITAFRRDENEQRAAMKNKKTTGIDSKNKSAKKTAGKKPTW